MDFNECYFKCIINDFSLIMITESDNNDKDDDGMLHRSLTTYTQQWQYFMSHGLLQRRREDPSQTHNYHYH